ARPQARPIDASPRVFSAGRAEQVLARILGPETPHPVSTEENGQVRARIVEELAALGLHPYVYHSFACHKPHEYGLLICASVNDVIADVNPGTGRAIVLLAHYDSVPAGPGAADDESGVATVIETARALIARGRASKHPVMAVLSDGEEADLLGAAAFLHDPALKARVGAVVNVEARGNQGPSLLFQTSPGDGPLIDLYANNTSTYATSSLYHEIYRFLPNDTDLTLFIGEGFPSFNFAYVGGIADYHTALDTRAHLDPVSLQQQGDNMLGVAGGLEQSDFASLHEQDDIDLDILGRWLPRAPASWALPLAIAAFLLLLAAAFLARGAPLRAPQWLFAFSMTPALLFVAVGSGFVLHGIAVLASGMPDPSYAWPAALRIALALALGGAALFVSRFAPSRAAAAAVWLWLAGLGVLVALFLPGLSPYFLIPTLGAAVLLLIAAFLPAGWEGGFGALALFLAAAFALLLWSAIGASGESVMGLKLHPLFTVPFAIGLSTLAPLFARFELPKRSWVGLTASLFVAALTAAVVQGMEPSYSTTAAQRLNITYIEDRHRALWAIDTEAPLPSAMRAVAPFSAKPEQISPATPASYVAPAGAPRFPLPTATVLADVHTKGGRLVTLLLHGSNRAAQMLLVSPNQAMLKAVDLYGWHFEAPVQWKKEKFIVLACMSRDCAHGTVTLTLLARASVTLHLYEHRFGLPGFAHGLAAARPATAVQSQNGDGVTLIGGVDVPARR
ncbi:MAG TPA: M20/M25/M40 family metallo-hydrolase, partial [Rhizomicrobium sp.]